MAPGTHRPDWTLSAGCRQGRAGRPFHPDNSPQVLFSSLILKQFPLAAFRNQMERGRRVRQLKIR